MKFKFPIFAMVISLLLVLSGTNAPSDSASGLANNAVTLCETEKISSLDNISRTVGGEYISVSAKGSAGASVYAFSEDNSLADECVRLTVERQPYKTEYTAFEQIDLSGAKIIAEFASGKSSEAVLSKIRVEYAVSDSLRVGDSSVTLFLGEASATLPVTVSARDYDISAISFDDLSLIYDGAEHSIEPRGEVIGLDGIALEYSVSGGGKNAGEYNVTLSFGTSSENYNCPPSITKKLTVTPLALDVVYEDLTFIYDGTMKKPRARIVTLEGDNLFIEVNNGAINAGKYTAKASFDNTNYSLKNSTVNFEIFKADIDLSGVFWSGESFEYNGRIRNVTAQGLPDTVILSGYKNAAFADAGEYVATAELVYDKKNYNPPAPLTHKWRITPIEYDVSGFGFSDSQYVYDGDIHYPESFGSIPKGLDESLPSYTFSGGAVHVSDGAVSVTVSFSSESTNYIAPSDMYATVRITPKKISVSWERLSFVYDGEYHSPTVICTECEVIVGDSYVDAGKYTATAVPAGSDYEILNPTVSFVINKAANYWLKLPDIGNFYEGSEPPVVSEAYFGEVEYSYFSSPEDDMRVSELGVGTYYMRAFVPESENYLPLYSDFVEFEVIKIAPVELKVQITANSLTALSKICESDIFAYYINNDGSKTAVDFSELSVGYQSSDKLLISDTVLRFSAGGLECSVEISVMRAEYDMSGVRWSNYSLVYDGEMKYSYLEGLPDGVSVREYSFKGASAAGKYELSAVFDYDSVNYNEPHLPSAYLTIEKKSVPLPYIEPCVYDGTLHSPRIEESELYTFISVSGVAAGEYKIIFTLNDPHNYAFQNGVWEVAFVIERRPITVQIAKRGNGYTVVSGSIVEGDSLGEEYYSEDGYVYLSAQNGDYIVTVLPVRERNENAYLWIIFLLTFLILLLSVVAYVIVKSPKRVALVIGMFREKLFPPRKSARSGGVNALATNEPPLDTLLAVDEEYANSLISNSLAKSLVTESADAIKTSGKKRCIVNIDTISEKFYSGAVVDINAMKEKGIVPSDAKYVKVLARGVIDKPITVIANAFSLSAVKMIALTGGSAKKVKRVKNNTKK